MRKVISYDTCKNLNILITALMNYLQFSEYYLDVLLAEGKCYVHFHTEWILQLTGGSSGNFFNRTEAFQSHVYSTVRVMSRKTGIYFFFLSSIMIFWGETAESNVRKYMQPGLLFLILDVV